MVNCSLNIDWQAGRLQVVRRRALWGMQMGPSDHFVSPEFAPTGIVEIERNGMIHRGTYRSAAAIVTVSYGGQIRQMQMRRRTDTPQGIAQMLLREMVAQIHEAVGDHPFRG
jgi:hypothetical protein